MSDLPVSYTSAGPVPLTAEELRAQLVSQAIALSPGLTTDLPGSLIEDWPVPMLARSSFVIRQGLT